MKSIVVGLAAALLVVTGCAAESSDPEPSQAPETNGTEQASKADATEKTGTVKPAMVEAVIGEDCPAPCYTWTYGICKYNGTCTH